MPIAVTIADDSMLSRKNVRKAVPTHWEAEITEATNGQEALEAVMAGKAEVLFLDLTMPVLDGYDVLRELQKREHKCVVIVISADIQPQAQALVRSLGAFAFLRKPLDPHQLHEALAGLGIL